MFFAPFVETLRTALTLPLEPESAWQTMSPAMRFPPNQQLPDPDKARKSAVLLLFYPNAEHPHLPTLALMKRAEDGYAHSGQISFPGGGHEAGDADFIATALRETREELGVDTSPVEVLGCLSPLHIPVSNSWVQPVVGTLNSRPTFSPDTKEVALVIEAPLPVLQAPQTRIKASVRAGISGIVMQVPAYQVEGHIVWGATAMMLSELLTQLNRHKDTANL